MRIVYWFSIFSKKEPRKNFGIEIIAFVFVIVYRFFDCLKKRQRKMLVLR